MTDERLAKIRAAYEREPGCLMLEVLSEVDRLRTFLAAAEKKADELAEALKWERVAHEDRRVRLAAAEQKADAANLEWQNAMRLAFEKDDLAKAAEQAVERTKTEALEHLDRLTATLAAAEQARDAALQRAEKAERSDRANAEDAINQAARADAAEATLRRIEAVLQRYSVSVKGDTMALTAIRAALSTPDKKEPNP